LYDTIADHPWSENIVPKRKGQTGMVGLMSTPLIAQEEKGIISAGSNNAAGIPVVIAIQKELTPGEDRVATVPEVVQKLTNAGHEVRIEHDAGMKAFYPDALYLAAGARITSSRKDLLNGATVMLRVQPPTAAEIDHLDEGTIVIGFMNATNNLDMIARMRDRKITAFALELVPRITRAQSMDALSSQATAGGYTAAILGANNCPKFLPMLTTAAGTIRPATVLILGAGVAGLMAIATAKRLGAIVEAYDVRRAAGEQVRSLGAKFLELEINAEGQGGYARELTAEEKVMEQQMVSAAVARADIVITTANIPGRKAPLLITKETVAMMRPGAVIVDLAAESGGNCELTQTGKTVMDHGVMILGPQNLPARIPFHASQMYAKNLQSFLGLLVDKDGAIVREFTDEILVASLLVHAGEVLHGPTRELLGGGKA
jgi:NAD(P) transhydrogenase subunit alpha